MNLSNNGKKLDNHYSTMTEITNIKQGLRPQEPAEGWNFYWNGSGSINEIDNYNPLIALNELTLAYYDPNGVVGSQFGVGKDLFFRESFDSINPTRDDSIFGRPGLGFDQTISGDPNNFDRYAIAAYSLDSSANISISKGFLRNVEVSFDGLSVLIYVNNTDTREIYTTPAGQNNQISFTENLGTLNAGDTIYVAVGANGNDTLDLFELGYSIVENVVDTGTSGNDTLESDIGNDTLEGLGGDDTLIGAEGRDNLIGGRGDDILNGGGGRDRLNGGRGNDSFIFDRPSPRRDTIRDFTPENDIISVSADSFGGGLTPGELPESQFTIGTSATDGLKRFMYNNTTGELFFDADGVGGEPQRGDALARCYAHRPSEKCTLSDCCRHSGNLTK